MINMGLTKAARRALAYVHVVGRLPQRLRSQTLDQIFESTNIGEVGRPAEEPIKVKPSHVAVAERHALYRASHYLLSNGFQVAGYFDQSRCPRAIYFRRCVQDSNDVVQEHAIAYFTGHWSIGFGKERGRA